MKRVSNWRRALVTTEQTVADAIRAMRSLHASTAVVVDDGGRLVGTVQQEEVRRAILDDLPLSTPALALMREPRHGSSSPPGQPRADPDQQPSSLVPVVDRRRRIVAMYQMEPRPLPDHWVVILAGGRGTRLRPLTNARPKPLLPVGDQPLLEYTVQRLREAGLTRVFMCVNYLADMIESHFGDGSRLGVDITYIRDDPPLGTAGPLALLPCRPSRSFIVVNSDILTSLDFGQLLAYHQRQGGQATVCVRRIGVQVPYGIVAIEAGRVARLSEKPIQPLLVNAGVYVFEPEVLDSLPSGRSTDVPVLIDALIGRKDCVSAFPVFEYWRDIGRPDDYEQANLEFPVLVRDEG
jgi:dTDP-glucose pyrophosphorylase